MRSGRLDIEVRREARKDATSFDVWTGMLEEK
jgi:hypothetical protein